MKARHRYQRRKSPSSGPGISLFPFLAVLICTMGALVPLLLAVSRTARLQAEAAAIAKMAEQSSDVKTKREDIRWRVEQLKAVRAKTESQLSEARLELGHLEDHSRRLRGQLAQYERTLKDLENTAASDQQRTVQSQAELDRLHSQVKAAEQQLADAHQQAAGRSRSYAVVPYEGPNQTRRRPIYLECRADAVVLQPEGVVLKESDFEGPLGPGNPLAAVLRATREYMLAQRDFDPQAGEPYPMLLVRPEGIAAYYAAREAMKSWGADFGYELVDDEWRLAFPPSDTRLSEVVRQTLVTARESQARLIASAPREYGRHSKVVYRALPTGGFAKETVAADDSDYSSAAPSDSIGEDRGGGAAGGEGRGTGRGGTGYGGGGGYGGGTPGMSGKAPGEQVAGNGQGYSAGGAGGGNGSLGDGPALTGGGGVGPGGGMGGQAYGAGGGSPYVTPGQASGPGGVSGGSGYGGGGGYGGTGYGNGSATGASSGGVPGGAGGAGGSYGSAGGVSGGTSGAAGNAGGSVTMNGGQNGAASGSPTERPDGYVVGQPPREQTALPTQNETAQAGASRGYAMRPGEWQPTPEPPPSKPKDDKKDEEDKKREHRSKESLVERRGVDWALRDAARGSVGVTRPIRVECLPDQLIILSDNQSASNIAIPLGPRTLSSIDTFIAGVWERMGSWGMAGRGMYWKPLLQVHVGPGGEQRFADLTALLDGSGIAVERK